MNNRPTTSYTTIGKYFITTLGDGLCVVEDRESGRELLLPQEEVAPALDINNLMIAYEIMMSKFNASVGSLIINENGHISFRPGVDYTEEKGLSSLESITPLTK